MCIKRCAYIQNNHDLAPNLQPPQLFSSKASPPKDSRVQSVPLHRPRRDEQNLCSQRTGFLGSRGWSSTQ